MYRYRKNRMRKIKKSATTIMETGTVASCTNFVLKNFAPPAVEFARVGVLEEVEALADFNGRRGDAPCPAVPAEAVPREGFPGVLFAGEVDGCPVSG